MSDATWTSGKPQAAALSAVAPRRSITAGWSTADTVVALFMGWMALLWLASGLPEAWSWLAADVGVLAYLLVAGGTWGWLWRRTRPSLQSLPVLAHCLLLLSVVLALAYEQAGRFGTTFVPSVEPLLIRADHALFGIGWYTCAPHAPNLAGTILESAYLFNYPLIFGGLLLLLIAAAGRVQRRGVMPSAGIAPVSAPAGWLVYASADARRRRTAVDSPGRLAQAQFAGLLLALMLCYAAFPLLPAVTPRLYFANLHPAHVGSVRAMNVWLLAREGVPWGIFPSGHVAGPTAMGAVFWGMGRRRLAIVYAVCAALIACATVYGDYHFVCDAVAGAAVGLCAAAVVVRRSRALTVSAAADTEEPVAA